MKKTICLFIIAMLISGCVTVQPKPIISSFGSSDIAKYKTFSVASSATPNTSEFLRDLPMLKDIAFRFQQEGFQFVNNIDKADFAITMAFIDAVGRDYIPPRTYTSVDYNPGVTTTNTMGTAIGMGNFVSFQGTSQSTSTDTMTATTTTTGGYFVPNYGVALALNIYDVKTKALVWSGAGASRADIRNVYASVDNIIRELVDKNLITPAYLKGEREKIRQGETLEKQDECLKPLAAPDKLGYYQGTYKDDVNGVGILASIRTQGQMLVLFFSLKNNTGTDFEFEPDNLKVLFQGENLYKFNRSEIADYFFKFRGLGVKESNLSLANGGIIGVLVGAIVNGISNSAAEAQKKRVDETVKGIYENYLQKHTIKPNENYIGYLYIAGPVLFPANEMVKVLLPLRDQQQEIDFVYEKGWLTVKDYVKKYNKKGG